MKAVLLKIGIVFFSLSIGFFFFPERVNAHCGTCGQEGHEEHQEIEEGSSEQEVKKKEPKKKKPNRPYFRKVDDLDPDEWDDPFKKKEKPKKKKKKIIKVPPSAEIPDPDFYLEDPYLGKEKPKWMEEVDKETEKQIRRMKRNKYIRDKEREEGLRDPLPEGPDDWGVGEQIL